jgi:hypothetical protein
VTAVDKIVFLFVAVIAAASGLAYWRCDPAQWVVDDRWIADDVASGARLRPTTRKNVFVARRPSPPQVTEKGYALVEGAVSAAEMARIVPKLHERVAWGDCPNFESGRAASRFLSRGAREDSFALRHDAVGVDAQGLPAPRRLGGHERRSEKGLEALRCRDRGGDGRKSERLRIQ